MSQGQTDTFSTAVPDTAAILADLPEMGPLYEPPPIPFTFETGGWSVLAGLLLLVLAVSGFFWIRHYLRNRYRREALAELERMGEGPEALPRVFVVLKRTAIHAFGRERVAQLYGREWLGFLDETGKQVGLSQYEQQVADALYRQQLLADAPYRDILLRAKTWIRTHAR